jgi:hypothetical protein
MMEVFSFLLGSVTGVIGFALFQLRRRMKAGDTVEEAARVVIFSGGGPGPGQKPK